MDTINQNEMMKLAFGLYDRGIEFKAKSFFDGIQFIIGDWDWDAICHSGSYGHENGLIEVMGFRSVRTMLSVISRQKKSSKWLMKLALFQSQKLSTMIVSLHLHPLL